MRSRRELVETRVWGIVFCCMASRAIHTEVVSDMSSEGFLLAYQRFTSLRGHPRKLWSDPGTNFVGAKPALEKLHKFLDQLNKSELQDTAAKHGTDWSWKIHPADSPHRNGRQLSKLWSGRWATLVEMVFSHGDNSKHSWQPTLQMRDPSMQELKAEKTV